jgi:rod shape determining protein RodA
MAQPNLGTALMLPPILMAVLFVGGARRITSAPRSSWSAWCSHRLPSEPPPRQAALPYQMQRINALSTAMRRPPATSPGVPDRLREGGDRSRVLQGTQNSPASLPAKHRLHLAIIGEEWGSRAPRVVAIFFVLVVLCLRVALQTREPFGRLMCAAIAISFASQGLENFGMTLGLTPITGVPLPFVSFGGSSLVTSFMALGLVLNVAFRRVRVVASQDLNPTEEVRVLVVVDDHPAGAQRFPDR